MKKIIIYIIYFFALLSFSLYSYFLIDPNITFFNHPLWSRFLEWVLQIGYYQRQLSWQLYFMLVCALFVFSIIFTFYDKKTNPFKIALLIVLALLISYPFLSHDFFNYMFDAKILTYYGKNPYLYKALDFPTDPWLRFMHWIHRTYPYGPFFLPITLIPSFLSFGKFFFGFILFKITNAFFYLLAVYYLAKLDKQASIFFATCPLVIVEGLVNGHNDLIGASLAFIGLYYIFKKNRSLLGRVFLFFSFGIKYVTGPVIFISTKKQLINLLLFIAQILLIGYLCMRNGLQPWYFLNLFVFLPFYKSFIFSWLWFYFGLLLSYYPYIALGGWDKKVYVDLKNQIIIISLFVNLIVFIFIKIKRIKLIK